MYLPEFIFTCIPGTRYHTAVRVGSFCVFKLWCVRILNVLVLACLVARPVELQPGPKIWNRVPDRVGGGRAGTGTGYPGPGRHGYPGTRVALFAPLLTFERRHGQADTGTRVPGLRVTVRFLLPPFSV